MRSSATTKRSRKLASGSARSSASASARSITSHVPHGRPGGRARVEMLEVAHAGEDRSVDRVAGGTCALGVRDAHRRGTMSSAAPWTRSCGTPSGTRAAGEHAARSPSPSSSRATPRLSPSRIASSRSTTPACATARVTFGCARRPEREVPAGRVADRDGRRADEVERRRHVVERRRPAAAAAEPAVLDVPRRPARGGQVLAELVHQVPVVRIAPEAAVEHHRRPARLARRRELLDDLRRVVAVPVESARRQTRVTVVR